MGDLIKITTWPKHPNVFYRFTSGTLLVKIKAYANAAIGIAKKPGRTCDFWVVIGEHNRRSWIKKEDDHVKQADTPSILTSDDYRTFWITWYGDSIQFGRYGEKRPVLTYTCSMPKLEYVAFAVISEQNPVHWMFEIPPHRNLGPLKTVSGGSVQWIATNNQLPDGAFIGGYENENLYIIRAPMRGSLTPGKFVPSHGVGYVSWGGQANEKNEFEVLCGYNVMWLPTSDDRIPIGAIVGGYSEDRHERLYVGRAIHKGHVIPGKVQQSHKCCYISYNEREIAKKNFEILVNPDTNKRSIVSMLIPDVNNDNDSEDGSHHDDDDFDNRSDIEYNAVL